MIQQKFSKIVDDSGIFRLTWIINNICTQHCDYCPSYLNSGKNHHYQWADAERFIHRLCEQHEKIHVIISGGEPTVSPWFKDLVGLFKDRGHTVAVSSNAVRAGSYWQDCAVDILTLSYHPQYHDDNFIQRVNDTQQQIPHIVVRVMMDPRYWDQCEIVYNQLQTETDVGLEVVRIVDWGAETPSYNLVQDQWLSQIRHRPPKVSVPVSFVSDLFNVQGQQIYADKYWPNQLINDRTNRFTGWQCNIGKESLFVQFDGSVRRGNCEQGGYIGRIQDQFFQLPSTPVTCRQIWCRCDTDMLINKSVIY
jgi:organic radical activating enzyme